MSTLSPDTPRSETNSTSIEGSSGDVQATANDPNRTLAAVAGNVSEPVTRGAGERYRVLHFHTKGGLGQVSVAYDCELERNVAFKDIREEYARDSGSRDRFLREARITSRLEHAGIVPVYGLGAHSDGRPFYSMRFIAREDLSSAMSRRQYGSPDALNLRQLLLRFVAVCNAIAFAHSRGVVHCDIKPANMMFGPFGESLVVDWGLAREVVAKCAGVGSEDKAVRETLAHEGERSTAGALVGTPFYMSPEQAAGNTRSLGTSADIFLLGATLYHVLAGAPPWSSALSDVLKAARRGAVRPVRQRRRDVARPLAAIFRKAMARAPSDRYASALDLAAEVQRWLAGEPVQAYRESIIERMARWAGRQRTFVTTAISTLVFADVALSIGLWAVDRQRRQTAQARADESQRKKEAVEARRKTRSALDHVSTVAIETLLANQIRPLPEHRTFLAETLELYRDFSEKPTADADARREVADTHLRMGHIRLKLGDTTAAQTAYVRALELYSRLRDEFPSDVRNIDNVAAAEFFAGKALAAESRTAQAEVRNRAALALCRQLTGDRWLRWNLVTGMYALAMLLHDTGRSDEADALLQELVALARQYTVGDDEPNLLDRLANVLVARGGFLYLHDRRSESLPLLAEALAIRRTQVRLFPDEPRFRAGLASVALEIANTHFLAARYCDAETHQREAVSAYAALAQELPAVPDYRFRLATAFLSVASTLTHQPARWGEAVQELRQSIALAKSLIAIYPASAPYRQTNAEALQLTGHFLSSGLGQTVEGEKALRESLAECDELAQRFPKLIDHQISAGRTGLTLGLLLRRQMKLPDADQVFLDAAAAIQRVLRVDPKHTDAPRVGRNAAWHLADLRRLSVNHAGMAEAAELLARITLDPAGDGSSAAWFLAQAAALVQSDDQLTTGLRQILAQEYARRAVDLICCAVQARLPRPKRHPQRPRVCAVAIARRFSANDSGIPGKMPVMR